MKLQTNQPNFKENGVKHLAQIWEGPTASNQSIFLEAGDLSEFQHVLINYSKMDQAVCLLFSD